MECLIVSIKLYWINKDGWEDNENDLNLYSTSGMTIPTWGKI